MGSGGTPGRDGIPMAESVKQPDESMNHLSAGSSLVETASVIQSLVSQRSNYLHVDSIVPNCFSEDRWEQQ